ADRPRATNLTPELATDEQPAQDEEQIDPRPPVEKGGRTADPREGSGSARPFRQGVMRADDGEHRKRAEGVQGWLLPRRTVHEVAPAFGQECGFFLSVARHRRVERVGGRLPAPNGGSAGGKPPSGL